VDERAMDVAVASTNQPRLSQLNDSIAADSRLGKSFRIGHSYLSHPHPEPGGLPLPCRRGGEDTLWHSCPTSPQWRLGIVTDTRLEQRLASMAGHIHQLIPAAEVRLFGTWARGEARPDSDVDRLITAPDAWLAQRDRFALLGELWGAVAHPDLSVDLVLHSHSEAARRAREPGSLVHEAFRDGMLLDGQP
jgi:predicted nucleotidyltransferase